MNDLAPRLHRGRLLLAATLATAPLLAAAQGVPKPGNPEPSTPPRAAPKLPAPAAAPAALAARGASFTLNRVRFVGATVFSDAELQALAAPQIGTAVTLADLEALAQRITERYRAAGYALAQAVVPAQEVSAGAVEISVLEGRLAQIRTEVDAAAPIGEAQVRAIAGRIALGQPLRERELSRTILLLSDLPGVRAEASLEAGEEAGSTDLIIGAMPDARLDLSVDADNHGSKSTSEYRIGVQGRWNSPLRIGDNLDLRLQLGSGGALSFGRIGYERPLGSDGLRTGLAFSSVEYALGGEFAGLDATGSARVLDLSLTYPLIRSRAQNLFAKALVQRKLLEDSLTASHKRMSGASFALNYEASDTFFGGGYNAAGITVLFGDLRLDAASRAGDLRETEGGFAHVNYNLSRLNAIGPQTTVFVGLAGQVAGRNLDSVEKVSLGGPRGVRAYAPSEISADEGHILNAELRFSVTPELSLQGFYDWGMARRNHSPDDAFDLDNRIALRGYGLGVFWGAANGFSLRASLAWRGSRVGEIDDRSPRLYVQLSKSL